MISGMLRQDASESPNSPKRWSAFVNAITNWYELWMTVILAELLCHTASDVR